MECWCDSLQCPKRSDFGRVDISDLKSFLCYMHHLDIAVSARKRSAFNWHRNNDKKKRRWEIFYIHSSHAYPRISEMNRYSTDHEKQTYTFPINQRCVCMDVCVFVWGRRLHALYISGSDWTLFNPEIRGYSSVWDCCDILTKCLSLSLEAPI